MTLFEANKSNLIVRYTELFTSGSAKVYYAEFSFSADWNGFAKIATFRNGSVSKSVAVDETNIFEIPWEVFANSGTLECGITGTKEDGTTLPTIWATVAPIKQGAEMGDEAKEVTPDIYEQLISRLDEGVTQAQNAAERAEAAAINQPYPNQVTGTWWVWNPGTGEYVDSGISSATYTLPPMTETALGGAMADPAQESDTQPVRIGADHKLYTAPGGGGGGEYTLPIATAEQLGGVKPVTKTDNMTQSVGVDSEGRLFTAEALDDVLYVTLIMGKGGTITADKTFTEIIKAAGSGICVIAQAPGTVLYLSSYDNTTAVFLINDGVRTIYAQCNSSDTWEFGAHTLTASDVGAIPSPATATVGQTVVVKAVGVNGVPTEWESADLPTGGGGIYGLLEQYDMFELAYGVLDSADLPARVVITRDSGGNAFDVDGIIVWTDIKSNVSYTSIAFNNRATVANPASHPCHYGLSHGVGKAFNLYLCGANNTFLQLLADGTLSLYKKQNKGVDGIGFNPAVNIQDVPSSITAICLSSQYPISSGTFYKVWGLKKKNV